MAAISESFAFLLRAIATHDRAYFLNIVSSEIASVFSADHVRNLAASGVSRDFFEAESSLLLATRTMWTLVPSLLFTAMDPNFERLAESSLRERFDVINDASVRHLALIFKRLRMYGREGRKGSSLNLDLRSHRAILEKQNCRCALCNYEFVENDLYLETEIDLPEVAKLRKSIEEEVSLESYFRSPQLDHIIPIFIGGDSKDNWQILCTSCNQGKGDALAWIFRRGWLPFSNIASFDTLTASLRYAVLCKHRAQVENNPKEELRLLKIDLGKLVTFENLKAVECDSHGVGYAERPTPF
jgi:hypothetical protein